LENIAYFEYILSLRGYKVNQKLPKSVIYRYNGQIKH
jgi:hypothetical protein